jgi:hypothetical protein
LFRGGVRSILCAAPDQGRLPSIRGRPRVPTAAALLITHFDRILIATGEASYHAGQDYCTSAFLSQAGVANDYI